MPAPTIQLTRGSITLTMTPIEHQGFRISGTITQGSLNGDWKITVWTQLINAAVVDDPDETAQVNISITKPFNEAPSEAAITTAMQELVNKVFDDFIPSPAP